MTLTLEAIIKRDRGEDGYAEFVQGKVASPEAIIEAARLTLDVIPQAFGSCVMVSAGFTAILKSKGISAVVILGDLLIEGAYAFKCRGNIPGASHEGEVVNAVWDGHAWVMVGGILCDLSLFRSAYATDRPNILKSFVAQQFGEGKGALLSPVEDIPQGMEFVPKYALNDEQIWGLLDGLSHQARAHQASV